MAPQIPDRWLKYQPIGERIEGTRFIAFKVPLREQINHALSEDNRLYGKLLLEKVPNLGIIIDLTNTNRYYDPNFFKNEGVEHQKLMIPGHVTPPPRLVNQFKEFVKQFIQNNSDNDKLIGVHCTHGVNRTGYLICNYMVSEMSVEAPEAIKKFAEARGHNIERQNYVDSLHSLNSGKGEEGNKPREKKERNAEEHLKNRQNWRTEKTERTDRVDHNWREQRDKPTARDSYRSSYNWRSDNHNRSNTRYSDAERYSWRRDNTGSLDTRNSGRERKRIHVNVDNSRDESGPTSVKRKRIAHTAAEPNRHSSYSSYKQQRQFRDSHNSPHTHNNNCPSNSNYSRSSHTNTNSSASKTDNKTNPRIRTDYYTEPRTSTKGGRSSYYSQRQQQQ